MQVLTVERCRQLVVDFRTVVSDTQGITFPVLEPPSTEDELAVAEQELGRTIPDDVKALYGLCSMASPLTAVDLQPLWLMISDTQGIGQVLEDLDGEGLLTDDPFDDSPNAIWTGDKPKGSYISFGSSFAGSVLIEVDGPLQGRVLSIDVSASGDYRWVCLARSLESFLELEIEFAKVGAYRFLRTPPRPGAESGDLYALPRVTEWVDTKAEIDDFYAEVASIAASFGGDPATVASNLPRPRR